MKLNFREFFDNEIKPQAAAEKILLYKADKATEGGHVDDAILFLKGALLVNPDSKIVKEKLCSSYVLKATENIENGNYTAIQDSINSLLEVDPNNEKSFELKSKLSELLSKKCSINLETIKNLAYDFVQKHCPDEDIIFDLVWDILKDSKEFILKPTRSFSNALAFVGKGEEDLKNLITPIIIISILGAYRQHGVSFEGIDKKSFSEKAVKIAKKNGASDELVSSISSHILIFFK